MQLKTEIECGRLLFKNKDSLFYKELNQIIWNQKRDKVDDVRGIHSDLLDACLYAMRYVTSHFVKKPKKPLTYGEKRMEDILKRRRNRDDDDNIRLFG